MGMENETNTDGNSLFVDYFEKWFKREKVGVVRPITLTKYATTHHSLAQIVPQLKVKDLNRDTYRYILNEYAKTHARYTIRDFHRQVKSCIQDILYEGYIDKDPTYNVKLPQGIKVTPTRVKFLEINDMLILKKALKEDNSTIGDMCLILLNTGMRYAEMLGITPDDLDFGNHIIEINKTWDYKHYTGFMPTKNASSVRDIFMDKETEEAFARNMEGCPSDESIFGGMKVWYNATFNEYLTRICDANGIPRVTAHSLRHTHASYLITEGVSIQSVAERLGHADTTTTQEVYIHLLNKLRTEDNNKIKELLKREAN